MINSTAILEQTVEKDDEVIFDTDQVRTRSCKCYKRGWLIHKEKSGLFDINKNGIYKISYNANVASPTAKGENALQLTANGEPIEGSKAIAFLLDSDLYNGISATCLVNVNLCYPYETLDIALVNASEDPILVKDANIVIDRVG